MPRLPALAPALVALALAACTVGPDYERPEVPLPNAYRYDQGAARAEAERRTDWWTPFADPELESLVLAVRAHNHEVRAALGRLEQARALVGIVRSEGLPQLALEPSVVRAETSDEVEVFSGVTAGRTRTTYTVPATLGWELDLFGRIRRGKEAAMADAEAVAADLDALLLLLETEAASTWLTIRSLDLELDVVRRAIDTRRDSTELVRRRFDLGAVSELDVAQAETQLAQSEADLAGIGLQRRTLEHALAVLLGEPASTFSVEPAPLDGRPPEIPAGLPSELLLARPDVRRSERVLAAENARVGVATAAFYPSFSLTGDAGWQSTDAADLFQTSARIWAIGPSLYLPLFQGGRNRANLARARARYEEVVEDYQQAVLVAIAEVETALAGCRFLADQSAAEGRAVDAALRARDVSRRQYEGGTVGYLSVLDAERTALVVERQKARLLGAEFVNTVQLLRALGGRW